jgi:hypothetical protein
MRGGKSFLLLLVLAVGIGAYAYFVESKGETSRAASVKREKVFTVDSDKIEEIEVKAATGEVTKLKKDAGTWRITSPAGLESDPAEAGAITTALAGLEQERVVEEKPASLKEFGLDPARVSITFRAAGETTARKLNLGMKTPIGSDIYATVDGNPKVFLIGAFREDSLNKTTFNLRDKTVLKFDRDGANQLTIDDGKKPMQFTKQGAKWRITQPVTTAADFTAVDGLIGRIFQSRMKSYVADDGTTDLKKYGLDKPAYIVKVRAGSAEAQLALGTKADDTSVYARDLSRPNIFTLESTLVDDLKRTPSDMRQKDVFDFRTFTAVGIDIVRGGQTYTFAKGDAGWKLTKPSAKDLDQPKVDTMLTNFSGLSAESFVDAAAASSDETVVTARYGDPAAPVTETVTFRIIPARGKDANPTVHAIRQGEKGAAVLTALAFDKAMAAFKELTGSK